MGSDVERLQRWERAGGIWRVLGRAADGEIAVALETCAGEPMEQFTSGDPDLLGYIGERDGCGWAVGLVPQISGYRDQTHRHPRDGAPTAAELE